MVVDCFDGKLRIDQFLAIHCPSRQHESALDLRHAPVEPELA
jgi:hypothetical protein